jgi:GT2 family glycosyltransferase/glycosyltransferase involved in cell wall biosynthesis
MELASIGLGGALLRWGDTAAMPAELDIFSAGIHVARLPLIRFSPGRTPLLNLVDGRQFLGSIADITLIDGQIARAGWGGNVGAGWSVTGEDTPFCFREETGDVRVTRYDLTQALGIQRMLIAPGETYYFSLDLAQHRCGVGLVMEWIDAWGRSIDKREAWREFGPMGGPNAADYSPLLIHDECPPGATALRLILMQGPPTTQPDAYVFFRNPRLTMGDPRDRPIVANSGLVSAEDIGRVALLPVGDAVREHAGPLEVGDADVRIALPDLTGSIKSPPPPLTVTSHGSYLDITFAAGFWDGELASIVTVDGILAGHIQLRTGASGTTTLLRLSPDWLDNQPHMVEIRGGTLGELRHRSTVILSAMQTPPDVLQRYVSRIERPALLPLADLRYEALLATIKRLGNSHAVDPAILAGISACHALVLKGPQENAVRFAPVAIAPCNRPRFSVIIPVHNKFYFTYFAICAVIYTCAGLPFEVVVVDDGSSDQTASIETIIDGVRVVRHREAQGFVGACNAGAAAALGDYLVFLNNDTEVVGNWLEEMQLPFELFERVGLTGAKLVYPNGRLQEAGGIIWNNGKPWNYGRDGSAADPRYGYTRQVDYCSGAAIMVSREAWDECGGFSSEFKPAYYEDTDIAFKLRENQRRVVYTPKATIVHYEGISNGRDVEGEGLKRYQLINRKTFEDKWRPVFGLLSDEGEKPDLEKDRGIIGRALLFDYQTPSFDKDAGSFAITQEIRLLQGLGYKVTFAASNLAYLDLYTEALERIGVEHLHAPFYSSLPEVLERRGGEFDLVYVHRYTTGLGLIPIVRQYAPQARVLLNCADVHFLREMRAARVSGSQDAFDEALRTRDAEIKTFREADAVLTYSDTEKAVVETFLDLGKSVYLTPWVAADPGALVPLAQRDGVAFVGSYDHPPNRDAIEAFIDQCWPQIRARHPGAILYVAGSGFERLQLKEPDPSIKVLGWVEDVSQFLAQRRVMVAPLRVGAGMKGKVIDAFNSGTPTVLSPVAAEGMPISFGPDSGIARTPDEWIEQVSELLISDSLWTQRAQRGLATIRERFSLENGLLQFSAMFDALNLPQMRPLDSGAPQGFVPRESLRDIELLRMRAGSADHVPFTLAAAAE